MLVRCLHCGKTVAAGSWGRRPLDIPVIKVCDALQRYRSVTAAAGDPGCIRGYIYKVLESRGSTPQEVMQGHAGGKRMLEA